MTKPPQTSCEREIATECIAVRLRLLDRVVTGLYNDALRPHGLRVTQMNILAAIAVGGPMRAVDVAGLLQLDASTLSRDLDRLIDKGWIHEDANEGRSRTLEVSRAGRDLLRAALPNWRKAQKQARELLSPAVADGIASVANKRWLRVTR